MTKQNAPRVTLVAHVLPQSDFVEYRGDLYFSALRMGGPSLLSRELHRFDGSTVEVAADINPGDPPSYVDDLVVYRDTLYFSAKHDNFGRDLWSFDGNTATQVADIAPSFSIVYKDAIYFRAMADHSALFRFDGVQTIRVPEIDFPGRMAVHDNYLFSYGFNSELRAGGLYRYDGTNAVFLMQFGEVTSLTSFNGKLYFIGSESPWSAFGPIWCYDNGTIRQVGRREIRHYRKMVEFDSSLFFWDGRGSLIRFDGDNESIVHGSGGWENAPCAFRGALYFGAVDAAHGEELWSYREGVTSLVVDISPGSDNSRPGNFVVFHDQLFLTAFVEPEGFVLRKLELD